MIGPLVFGAAPVRRALKRSLPLNNYVISFLFKINDLLTPKMVCVTFVQVFSGHEGGFLNSFFVLFQHFTQSKLTHCVTDFFKLAQQHFAAHQDADQYSVE